MIKVAVVSMTFQTEPATDPYTEPFQTSINNTLDSLKGKRIIGISYTTNVLDVSQISPTSTNPLAVWRKIVHFFNAFIEYDDT